ncbi:MAG: SNF2-related protein, partial [Pirellulales bacterium]
VHSQDPSTPWADYTVTSLTSGKSYRVALRGDEAGRSYCSCPDFATNGLGTCKHILHVLDKARRRFRKADLARPHFVEQVEMWFDYGEHSGLRFNVPDDADPSVQSICRPHVDRPLTDAAEALKRIRRLQKSGCDVVVFPDAESWIEQELTRGRLQQATADIRRNPAKHALRKELLKVELLPYQLDGVAFAAGAGRAILADDMGLGKTIQGIGTAELLARLAGIERVLVICPASLKGQWRDEVTRFCNRSVELITGGGSERARQYSDGAFFTVCNYEQVLRDLDFVERVPWDLIILDEGQRIKNWESKTSRIIQSLRSRFALVLTGTPLENRLEELYNVVKFVDPRLMGPAYRFLHKHRVVADTGRVSGYQRLDELREQLRPILLRRTRNEVMKQLPERTTSILRIRPTDEQVGLHNFHMRTVQQITRKSYLTEMDLLRLQKALLMCRMAADSTYLVTHERPGFSSKLDRLTELLTALEEQPDRKIVLFSEWRRMLDEIEPVFRRLGMPFVRLDGGVPQNRRPALIREFQQNAECRAILMTNAGS